MRVTPGTDLRNSGAREGGELEFDIGIDFERFEEWRPSSFSVRLGIVGLFPFLITPDQLLLTRQNSATTSFSSRFSAARK